MTFPAKEFIRRFLLDVLPPAFHRIRHFGQLAGCRRRRKLVRCRRLLGMPPADYRDRFEALTGESLHQCPACRCWLMVAIERLQPDAHPPLLEDAS